jgi:hypothetical protein
MAALQQGLIGTLPSHGAMLRHMVDRATIGATAGLSAPKRMVPGTGNALGPGIPVMTSV